MVRHGGGDEVVAFEDAGHLFLILGHIHRVALAHELVEPGGAARAHQRVQKHIAQQMVARIDHEDLKEGVGQIIVAGVVDMVEGLARRPEGRGGEQGRLHETAC